MSGEIGEDFAYYLTTSEQIPSATSLGVFVETASRDVLAAGGYIVQVMPGGSRTLADDLMARLAKAAPVTEMVLYGKTPAEILEAALGGGYDVEVLETREASFSCPCSRESVMRMLGSLDPADLQEMIDDGTGERVICHVCNEHYDVTTDELRALQDE